MKKTSKKVVFFGNERLATGVSTEAPTLQALIKGGYEVVAVVSNFERGTSRNARNLEIAKVAEQHNIPVLLPKKLADIQDQLASYQADIGVLVAYGRMVPRAIMDIFPRGIVNIHPSLLPKHRGPTPIESVILNDEEKTGVSIMQLAKAMDAGPVFAQSELELAGDETKQTLAESLSDIGSAMLLELLPGILDGTVAALPQDEARATYDNLIAKGSGQLDWNKPASLLERQIRAFQGWPKSSTTLDGKEVIITKARAVVSRPKGAKPGDMGVSREVGIIMIATSEGTFCIEKLKPAGKKEMTSQAFLAGHRSLRSSL